MIPQRYLGGSMAEKRKLPKRRRSSVRPFGFDAFEKEVNAHAFTLFSSTDVVP